MKVSINRIRAELKSIAEAIIPINSFFWGDLHRAEKENDLQYPVFCCYKTTSSFTNNQSDILLVIEIADLHYENPQIDVNEIESDTEQWLRVVFNLINKTPRWNDLGKITSASSTEAFKYEMNGDLVAGHRITINFKRRDNSGYCNLPVIGYDFGVQTPPSEA